MMILNDATIQDLPETMGLFAVFLKLSVVEDSLNCLVVRNSENISEGVKKIFFSKNDIDVLKSYGSEMYIIYETTDVNDFEDIKEKEEEWNLIYKPAYIDYSDTEMIRV